MGLAPYLRCPRSEETGLAHSYMWCRHVWHTREKQSLRMFISHFSPNSRLTNQVGHKLGKQCLWRRRYRDCALRHRVRCSADSRVLLLCIYVGSEMWEPAFVFKPWRICIRVRITNVSAHKSYDDNMLNKILQISDLSFCSLLLNCPPPFFISMWTPRLASVIVAIFTTQTALFMQLIIQHKKTF